MSEEQMNDSTFGRLFVIMLIAMMVLTAIIIALAIFASSDVTDKLDAQSDIENSGALAERIAPVGKFSAVSEVVSAAPVEAVALSPEEAYTKAGCGACHASGVLGAPKFADKESWLSRIEKGKDTLYNSAINGIGNMAAKGGNPSLTDESVKSAVDYMLQSVE